ncbi:MAG TPA: helix-turn-helix domain-containing protein [Terriglobia bacterium]|nr:helix-turn-helix domain-containing protein [Terriglobia bacterium]
MPRKSELKPEERVEVVLALLRREEPAAALARRYQVSEATIYRWRDAFLAGGKAAVAKPDGAGDQASARRIEQLERELGQRAQIIGELSIANDLLKKLQTRSY